MKVQIINKSKHSLPQYATSSSAGMDLRANLDNPIVLKPLQRCLVPTGLYIALPEGFEAQIRPRSGLALKKGITLLNTPGTIDADYRGEIGVIVINLSAEDFIIEDGERIAQMVIARYEQAEWQEVEVLEDTERGAGGLKAGIRVRQRGVRGRAQGGKGTKEENRRGLRAGSGEGPQSEELLQRDDSAPGGKEWEGENSEPNCKSIR